MIQGLNHCTVLTDDLPRTLDFYVGVLGLSPGARPDFSFPGAWLYVGPHAVLHVVAGRVLPAARAGVIDHIAFTATDFAAMQSRLQSRGVPYEVRPLPGSSVMQLFCHDPNGAKIELTFASEVASA
jgi:catechol 2,3-dioxygenase-like lactoylglutathione lyase family enzyme